MRFQRLAPHSTQQSRDHYILVVLRQYAERDSRQTAFQEHGAEILIERQQSHGRVSFPEAKTLNLVLSLHVRHGNFEDRRHPVRGPHSCHVRATRLLTIERTVWRQAPTLLQLS